MVLEDWHRERGHKITRLGVALLFAGGGDVDGTTDVGVGAVADDEAEAEADVGSDPATDDVSSDDTSDVVTMPIRLAPLT
jgi:hypothetical protein